MALINPVPVEQATGVVKNGYDMFMSSVGTIPRPMEVLSVSPELFAIQLKRISYFAEHPTMSYVMLDFVIKVMKAPSSVTANDISHLSELGSNDRDMVDALAKGVGMIDHAIMMEAFGVDQQCLVG